MSLRNYDGVLLQHEDPKIRKETRETLMKKLKRVQVKMKAFYSIEQIRHSASISAHIL